MGHYEELGVAPAATPAEIRRAYLALAREFHPDGLSDAPDGERERAGARMARVNAAWSVLSDGERRAAYDLVRREDLRSGATIRDVGDSWTPYDDGDDDSDQDLLDDTPSGAPTLPRGLTFLPAVLAVAGFAAVVVGFLIGLFGVAALGLVLIVAAGLSFVLIPLAALASSSRADRDG